MSQAVAPKCAAKVPAAHATQLLWPASSANVPAGHGSGLADLVGHWWPAGHVAQSDEFVAPVALLKVPPGQSVSPLLPRRQYVPGPQSAGAKVAVLQ